MTMNDVATAWIACALIFAAAFGGLSLLPNRQTAVPSGVQQVAPAHSGPVFIHTAERIRTAV